MQVPGSSLLPPLPRSAPAYHLPHSSHCAHDTKSWISVLATAALHSAQGTESARPRLVQKPQEGHASHLLGFFIIVCSVHCEWVGV